MHIWFQRVPGPLEHYPWLLFLPHSHIHHILIFLPPKWDPLSALCPLRHHSAPTSFLTWTPEKSFQISLLPILNPSNRSSFTCQRSFLEWKPHQILLGPKVFHGSCLLEINSKVFNMTKKKWPNDFLLPSPGLLVLAAFLEILQDVSHTWSWVWC